MFVALSRDYDCVRCGRPYFAHCPPVDFPSPKRAASGIAIIATSELGCTMGAPSSAQASSVILLARLVATGGHWWRRGGLCKALQTATAAAPLGSALRSRATMGAPSGAALRAVSAPGLPATRWRPRPPRDREACEGRGAGRSRRPVLCGGRLADAARNG